MTRTNLTALVLTLLMLLLVALAAFIFLYQGRLGLEDDVSTLAAEQNQMQQQILQTGSNLAAAEATRDLSLEALATAEADRVLLEGELVTNQQQVDDLSQDLADTNDELDTANAALNRLETTNLSVQQQVPLARITNPADGDSFAPGDVVSIVVAASDVQNLTAVNLTLDDETLASYDVDEEPIFVGQTEWTADEAGDYVLGVMAVNANGRASDLVTITIHVELSRAVAAGAIRDSVEANVIALRGLTPLEEIDPILLSSDALRDRVEADFEEDTSPAESREDAITLSAFDFMDKDYDLYQALIDLQSEAVAGFYDPETAEFVVVSDDDELSPNEQWTHAHEFMHALQDQYYPLELISDESLDSEASFALRSLAEGEATLIQLLYLQAGYFTEEEIQGIFADSAAQDTGILEELPPIIVSSFTFPYDTGFNFVLELYNGGDMFAEGDFSNIEAVWNDLPQTSEQIIHPERYLSGDDPISVSLPPLTSTLGIGWRQLDEDTFGEFTLREYLRQELNDAEVEQAATGWGGDRYAVYWNEDEEQLVMALRLVWDSPIDAAEFATLYEDYPTGLFATAATPVSGGDCWQGTDAICLFADGDESLIVRAPDVDTAVLVRDEIQ